MTITDTDTERAEYIADLRAFAALIESNPLVPTPNYGTLWAFIHAGPNRPTQDERFDQVHDFAEAFGVPVKADHDGDRSAEAKFGRITLRVHANADKKPGPRIVTRPAAAERSPRPDAETADLINA